MTTPHDIILDERARVMFRCGACGEPMARGDFFDQGMRLPERGESATDYCDAELIDRFEHTACSKRQRSDRAS